MFLSWNGSSLYMHLSFIRSLKFKNWCCIVSACICLLCVQARGIGARLRSKVRSPSTGQAGRYYSTLPYRCTSSVTSVSLRVGSCPMWRFIFWSNFRRKTTFPSYVPRFVLNNCSERENPVSFTVVSCCSVSPVHFSRMTEQQCTAECNVSFGYNAAGGRRVVKCIE